MDRDLFALEERIEQFISLCQNLRTENQELRTRVAGLEVERAERVGRTLARLQWDARTPGFAVHLRQRALAAWANVRGGGIESRCLARRLAGYADEVAVIRGR